MTEMEGLPQRISHWARKIALGRRLAIGLTIAAFGSAIATYVAISDLMRVAGETRTVIVLLLIDLVLFLLLALVVSRNLVVLWRERRERRKRPIGAHLHTRMVVLFSLVAVAPAVVVSVFSAIFFNFSLDSWFSDNMRRAISESRAVATHYFDEHRLNLGVEILAMTIDLGHLGREHYQNVRYNERIVARQAAYRKLDEAHVLDGAGTVLIEHQTSYVRQKPTVPAEALEKAETGEIVFLQNETGDRLRALSKLDSSMGSYLYIGKGVRPSIIAHIENTKGATLQYDDLEEQRSLIEITFAMLYIFVSLLLLLAAVRVGLAFADRMSRPIAQLAKAADLVGSGNLSARVEERSDTDELAKLERAFNRMASQVQSQSQELGSANEELKNGKHFIETVLSGVTAGVIGLDEDGRIKIANRSASNLMGRDLDEDEGTDIRTLLVETDEIIRAAKQRPEQPVEREILFRQGGAEVILQLRLACDVQNGRTVGFVATFDDITELVQAQRKAAWSDVARRIAHEIKNPLTPIQLSAERLKRKYLPEIKSDPGTFAECTETIVRQVGDIGSMVDEFSAFARSPSPQISLQDIVRICREALILPRNAHPEIRFEIDPPEYPVEIPCDQSQISRALSNLIQNAIDAIEARTAPPDAELPAGLVTVKLSAPEQDDGVVIEISDNGKGLPAENRSRLVEPYVTTRGSRGTGLGLAIVKQILEHHRADLELEDSETGGARARIVFAASERPMFEPTESFDEVLDGV